MLRRHRWVLVASTLLGLAAGLAFASMRGAQYEATATILVGERPTDFPGLDLVGLPSDADRVGTEMEVLQSRTLAKAVVDSLGLQVRVVEPEEVPRPALIQMARADPDAPANTYVFTRQQDGSFRVVNADTEAAVGVFPVGGMVPLRGARVVLAATAANVEQIELAVDSRAGAVEGLMEGLSVSQPGVDVNVIHVTYRGSDPWVVREVPNVLTARYAALRESVQKAEARSTARFLREQLEAITGELATAEERLRDFREAQQVIAPEVEARTGVTQLAELEADRNALAAERNSLAGLLAELRAGADATDYRRLLAFPSLVRNEIASELLRSLSDLENQRATLATRLTEETQEIQTLDARIAQLERQIQALITTYLAGLSNQVASLDRTLAAYRQELGTIPARETEFARLSRQPKVLETTYELLQTRLQEAEIAEAVDDASIRLVDPADMPEEPAGPMSPLVVVGFGMVGLLLGLGLVLAREYADPTVRTRAELEAAVAVPVLSVIPRAAPELARRRKLLPAPAHGRERLGSGGNGATEDAAVSVRNVLASNTPTPWSDAYNRLHANVMFADANGEARVVLFTSPLSGDGKTSTAVGYAMTLAQTGLKVLLVDADLRRGNVHELLGVERGPGLVDILNDAPTPGVLRTTDVSRGMPMRFIPTGKIPPNPVELLNSTAMSALVEIAGQEYDRVVIDSAPLNLFPDAAVLSRLVDGVLIVACAGETPFDALVDTADQLRKANARVYGAVLNGVDLGRNASYESGYRWYREMVQRAPSGERSG